MYVLIHSLSFFLLSLISASSVFCLLLSRFYAHRFKPIYFISNRSNEESATGMIGCYLLTSANPYYKGHTYIGFTVDPQRRLRQHNGELTNGAFRTEKRRPWQMVCYVFGFATHHGGLQLEWSWQHPLESKRVCEALKNVRRIGQHHLLKAKLRFLFEHFQTPPWCCAPLHLHFFTDEYYHLLEGFPPLPPQFIVTQGTHKQLYEWQARLRKPVLSQLLSTLNLVFAPLLSILIFAFLCFAMHTEHEQSKVLLLPHDGRAERFGTLPLHLGILSL